MQDVNWWLMALAFLLGLALTLALMIRRVKREVPQHATLGTAAGTATGADAAGPTTAATSGGDTDAEDTAAKPGAVAAGAAAAGGAGAAAAKFADTSKPDAAEDRAVTEEPYGPGTVRVAAGAAAPSGYDIKGNEDSMLYHSPDSPSYAQTIAEIWFRDEEAAIRAGFNRWDSGKSQRDRT